MYTSGIDIRLVSDVTFHIVDLERWIISELRRNRTLLVADLAAGHFRRVTAGSCT